MLKLINKFGPKLAPAFRLTAFAFVLVFGITSFTTHRAVADLEHSFLGFGEEMMRFTDGATPGDLQHLTVNGSDLYLLPAYSDLSVSEVLDRYETVCNQRGPQVGADVWSFSEEEWTEIEGRTQIAREAFRPTLREEEGDRGFVACLDMGGESVGMEGLVERLTAFGESANIKDVGNFRYVFASKGSTHASSFVTMWSDSDLNLETMFPVEGDAPGRPVGDLERPPGSRRIISSWAEGHRQQVNSYSGSSLSSSEIIAHYESTLPEAGYTLTQQDPNNAQQNQWIERMPESMHVLFADRGQDQYVVVTGDASDGGYASVMRLH